MNACPDCHGKGASTHDIKGNIVYYCNCEPEDYVPSDTERLLAASIEMVQKDQRIAELEHDNALLRVELQAMRLRLERRLANTNHLPALLRPQI